jgi:hypothetical protein
MTDASQQAQQQARFAGVVV